jgi:hypothetical protein
MTRLHWFWRGLIAFFLTQLILGGSFIILYAVRTPQTETFARTAGAFLVLLLPLITLLVYGFLTALFCPYAYDVDGETHCRKCGHILRGISEPRCPECGEPI